MLALAVLLKSAVQFLFGASVKHRKSAFRFQTDKKKPLEEANIHPFCDRSTPYATVIIVGLSLFK